MGVARMKSSEEFDFGPRAPLPACSRPRAGNRDCLWAHGKLHALSMRPVRFMRPGWQSLGGSGELGLGARFHSDWLTGEALNLCRCHLLIFGELEGGLLARREKHTRADTQRLSRGRPGDERRAAPPP